MVMNDVRVILSEEIITSFGMDSPERPLRFVDRLAEIKATPVRSTIAEARDPGVLIAEIQPLTACYFEISLGS